MLRLLRAVLVFSLLPFALAAIYTWWFAARGKGLNDAELVYKVVHTQPGRTLYSLCNLVLYGWIVPATIVQSVWRKIRSTSVTTYKLGPLPAQEFDELMRTIGKHYGRSYDKDGIFV